MLKTALIIINLLGFATFPLYYGNQMLNTNLLLWAFVPDCQLGALFFAMALLTRKEWIKQLGIASSMKYGLWTLLVVLPNINYFGSTVMYWINVIAHVILMLQPLIIIKEFKLSKQSIPAFTYLFLNDLSDYLLSTHPPIPADYLTITTVFTPIITILLLILSGRKLIINLVKKN